MNLGAFSMSLAVKDIHASLAFYQKLGFQQIAGEIDAKWVILKNREHVIGLFQDMFSRNVLTFNPGWNQNAELVDDYTDIRDLQQQLKNDGVNFVMEVDEASTGPSSFMILDPDGNPILVDQHR